MRGDPTFRDRGRAEITGDDEEIFEFRTLTLRQLRDARNFMHNGFFTSVRAVVEYFNAGVPLDREAGSAVSISSRFTHPRGQGTPRGLGLSSSEVSDLTDFIENALYDPAFVRFDPNSPTRMFQPSVRDLTYSLYRPDLAALGVVDGRMPSGLTPVNNDPLSRRDMGFEFLDVTSRVDLRLVDSNERHGGREQEDVWRITNNGTVPVDTHLLVLVQGLSANVRLEQASGTSQAGNPYRRLFLTDGVLPPGRSLTVTLELEKPHHSSRADYSLQLLSGQGNP